MEYSFKKGKINTMNKILAAMVMTGMLLLNSPAMAAEPATSSKCEFGSFEMPLPGFSGCIDTTAENGFVPYINLIVKLFLGIIVAAGVIAVVIGGYIYMTAGGNASQVDKAKTVITSAIFGIALALASWIILDLINPQLASQLKEPLCQSSADCGEGYTCSGGLCVSK